MREPKRSLHGRSRKDGVVPHHTLDEIAEVLGVTRARVGQIEAKALAKMVRGLKRYGITREVLHRAGFHW